MRPLEVVDAFMGGAVAGNVGGKPPVFKEAAPLDEGAVVGVARVNKRPEPVGERLDEQVVVVTRGSIEGGRVDLGVGLFHSSLGTRGVVGGDTDEAGSSPSPTVWH